MDIPWSRLADATGRATRLPHDIDALLHDASTAIVKRLADRLVSQDTVMQATPFAVFVLVGHLEDGRVQNPAAVQDLLRHVLVAADQAVDSDEPEGAVDLNDLLASTTLLPRPDPSVSDDEVFEEWMPREDEFQHWARVTRQLIARHFAGPGRP